MSSAVMGGTVVAVGATVVLVVMDSGVAVDVVVSPAHPPTSTTSRTVTARRAAKRQVLGGMRRLTSALHRGEGHVPRDMLSISELTIASRGDGAAARATSSGDAPCPTGRGSRGFLASRSAVLAVNVHLATPS